LIKAVAKIDKNTTSLTMEDVVELMQQVRFDLLPESLSVEERERRSKVLHKERGKTKDDILAELKELQDDNLRFDLETEKDLKEIFDFAKSENWTDEDTLQEFLAVGILRISKRFMDQKEKKLRAFPGLSHTVDLDIYYSHVRGVPYISNNYGGTLRSVAAIPGCAGGGGSGNNTVSFPSYFSLVSNAILGTDLAEKQEKSTAKKKTLRCTCPFCNNKVNAIIANGKITCPEDDGGCGKSAPYQC